MDRLAFLFLLFLSSCYHLGEKSAVTLAFPTVTDDIEGALQSQLIKVASSSALRCQNGGAYELAVHLISDNNERTGFRYDKKGTVQNNRLVAVEARRTITAEMTVRQAGKIVFGPKKISADSDYDHIDSNSLSDMLFTNSASVQQTSLRFSSGQLDSLESAHEAALNPLMHKLACKIIDELTYQLFCLEKEPRAK